MNVIKADLINFKRELVDYSNNKENVKPELFQQIDNGLDLIFKNIKGHTAPINASMQKEVAKLLTEVDQALHKCPQKKQLQTLSHKIEQIQALFKHIPVVMPPKVEKPLIDTKMGFICNFDSPDHNGAMSIQYMSLLGQNTPFIVTRSLLKEMELTDFAANDKRDLTLAMVKTFFDNEARWQIFELSDANESNDLLLFIPVSLFPDKNEAEKLDAMDLKSDGSLRRISATEAFQIPRKKATIDTLAKFFSESPQHHKLFYLAGHGSSKTVGGLHKNSYIKWLELLQRQKCQGLTISSCHSGGESSLISLDQNELSKAKHKKNLEEPSSSLSFPVVVRSIGDFATHSGQKAEQNMDLYFKELEIFLQGNLDSTAANYRKVIEKIEGDLPKNSANRIKVYFPSQADAAGGYRSLGEHGLGYPLTYSKLKGIELQHNLLHKNKDDINPIIEVSDFTYLDVHPLSVAMPVRFKGKDPIILSMIPGKGHHFLKSIELASNNPDAFIKSNLGYYSEMKSEVSKAFFIGSLKSAKMSFEEVGLYISPRQNYCVYKHRGQYYYMNEQKTIPITAVEHAIFLRMAANATQPSLAAVRASSGGQESRSDVLDILLTEDFGSVGKNKPQSDLFSEEWLKQSLEELLRIVKSDDLTEADRLHLCFLLLDYERGDAALEVFKQCQLKVDQDNLFNTPLLSYAIQKRQTRFAEYLIEHHANVNALDLKGDAPLHYAVAANNTKIVELLLKSQNIRLDIENKRGITPLVLTWPKYPELFQKLLKQGAALNYVSRSGESVLSRCVFYKHGGVDILLAAGANPNLGAPSAITEAVRNNDISLVQELIKHGGQPFEKDGKGNVPFIEAILHGSSKLVEVLLQEKDIKFDVQDAKGLVPVVAAVFESDPKIIDSLLAKGFKFPENLSQHSQKFIYHFMHRASKMKNPDSMRELFKFELPPGGVVHQLLILSLLNNNLDMLTSFVKDGLISPTMIKDELVKNRKNLQETSEQWRQLLSVCLEKGLKVSTALKWGIETEWLIDHLDKEGKLNTTELQELVILYAFENNNIKQVERLVEKGYKVSPDVFHANTMVKKGYKLGGLPLMQKVVEWGKQWGTGLQELTNEEKKELWHLSVNNEDTAAIVWLLSQGLSPTVKNKNQLVKNMTKDKIPLLVSLIEKNIIEASSLSNQDIEMIITLVRKSSPEVLKKIITKLSLDLNTLLEAGKCTIFQLILLKADSDLIQWCIDQGADVNRPNQEGLLPIHAILTEGNSSLVDFLLQKGVKLDTLEAQQEAYFYALKSRRPEMIDLLHSKGYKVTPEFFMERHFLIESLQGDIAMISKIVEFAQQIKADLSSLEDEDKKMLWKFALRLEDQDAKKIVTMFLDSGISPVVNGKNMLEKWIKHNPDVELEQKLKAYS